MLYDRPDSLSAAIALAAQVPAPRLLAGGTDLYPATEAAALAGPVLDLTGIAALDGIAEAAGTTRIGACTRWATIRDADLPPAFDALREAAAEVGGVQVQNAGTIGGNLCNASPAADGVPPLLVLDAAVELTSTSGTRRLPLGAFLDGPRRTARSPAEVLTAIVVPPVAGRSAFLKLGARRHLVISIASVAARLAVADGRVTAAAIAVGACTPVPTRLPGVEAALVGHAPDPARVAAADVATCLAAIDDVRASAAYRVEAATELVRRAVRALAP